MQTTTEKRENNLRKLLEVLHDVKHEIKTSSEILASLKAGIKAQPAECVEYMASYAFAASIKEVLFYYAAESGVHSFMPNEVLKDLNKLGYFDSFEWCNNDSIKVKIIDENDLGFDYDEYLLAKKDDVYILLHRTDIQM